MRPPARPLPPHAAGASRGAPHPRSRAARTPRLGRLLLALGLLAALIGCRAVDPLRREICLAVVAAVELDAPRIEIVAVDPAPDLRDGLRLSYRLPEPAGEERGPEAVETRRLACAFGDPDGTGDPRHLVSVVTEAGRLPLARLVMLERFWVGDAEARSSALARLEIAPAAREQGLVSLPPSLARLAGHVLDAAVPGLLYALTGLGCALIYGLIGRLDLAFGDVVTLGAYAAAFAALAVGLGGDAVGGVVLAASAAALVVAGLWNAAIGSTVFGPLAFRAGQPILVAGVGLSVALQEFLARAQGVRDLLLPAFDARPVLLADGDPSLYLAPARLAGLALGGAAVLALLVIFPKSAFGRRWRAVADDRLMAAMLGIDARAVLVATFLLAGLAAGLAGALMVLSFGAVSFHDGTLFGLKSVTAAVVGGMGSLPGAVAGGLLVAAIEAAWTVAVGAEWRDAAVYALLAAMLILRPEGLFGSPLAPRSGDDRG